MESSKPSRRGLKICCGVTLFLLVVIAAAVVALSFTIFKVRNPVVYVHPYGLDHIHFSFSPNLTVNGTLSMVITTENPNYGSFHHPNATANVTYHGVTIAEVPIEAQLIPPRSVHNLTTSASIMGDKLVSVPSLIPDYLAGSLNMTSTSALAGKVILLKVVKIPATLSTTCNMSIFVFTKKVESTCWTTLHL